MANHADESIVFDPGNSRKQVEHWRSRAIDAEAAVVELYNGNLQKEVRWLKEKDELLGEVARLLHLLSA